MCQLDVLIISRCGHCNTTSHSTTPHPMNKAKRWYNVVTSLHDLSSGLHSIYLQIVEALLVFFVNNPMHVSHHWQRIVEWSECSIECNFIWCQFRLKNVRAIKSRNSCDRVSQISKLCKRNLRKRAFNGINWTQRRRT